MPWFKMIGSVNDELELLKKREKAAHEHPESFVKFPAVNYNFTQEQKRLARENPYQPDLEDSVFEFLELKIPQTYCEPEHYLNALIGVTIKPEKINRLFHFHRKEPTNQDIAGIIRYRFQDIDSVIIDPRNIDSVIMGFAFSKAVEHILKRKIEFVINLEEVNGFSKINRLDLVKKLQENRAYIKRVTELLENYTAQIDAPISSEPKNAVIEKVLEKSEVRDGKIDGDPDGIRIRITTVKGWCPNR